MKLKTKDMILVALFAALTAVGAFIKIPIPYVPFTLQYFFCAFSGILLGARLGALSQIVYVVIGLIGVPVFTNGGGPSYIFQTTFGYLIGFIVGAYVIGRITERMRGMNFIKNYLAVLSGMFFVYLFGMIHLYVILNFYLNKPKSITWVLMHGCVLFLGSDLFLSAIIAVTATKVVPLLRKAGFISSAQDHKESIII